MSQAKSKAGRRSAHSQGDSGLLALLQITPWAASALLGLIALLIYANSLGGAFVFDDTVIIQGNKSIEALDWTHLKEIFGGHYWQAVESRGGLYRPVVMLSYAVNFALGGNDPQGYHFFNVVVHAANGILVFLVLEALFSQRAFSLLAALLFILHPIRTEGVASIVGRAESLAAFFMLAAWLVYLRYLRSHRFSLVGYSSALFVLAALSKESAFCFVGLPFLTDWVTGKGNLKERVFNRAALLRYIPFGVGLVFVLILRFKVLGGLTPLYINPGSNPLVQADWWHRFLTATYVFTRYLGLLIFPLSLSADYSYNQIPTVTEFFSPRGLFPVLVLVSLVTATALSLKRYRVLFFSGALFFLSFVMTSNWIRPIGTIMGERLMYFPALGFDCSVAFVLSQGLKHPRWRSTATAVGLLLVFGYGARTINRNLDWRSHYTLFQSAVAVAPNSSLTQSNLAAVLLNEKHDVRGAIDHATRAAEIQPDTPSTYFTLGQAQRQLGALAPAAQAFEMAARLAERTSGGTSALRAAAEIHEALGQPGEARVDYEKLLNWRPTDIPAHLGLSRAHLSLGETAKAKAILDLGLRIAPGDPALQRALRDFHP